MKILAALKRIKHLDRKIEKTMKRIEKYCSYIVENEQDPKPPYDGADIKKMQQQITDWSVEKARIRAAMHKTNIETKVLWDKRVYTIDELLLLQKVLLPAQIAMYKLLRRKEKGGWRDDNKKDSYVVLQYDPKERDAEIEKIEYQMEQLDELLDNTNIETDVVGL